MDTVPETKATLSELLDRVENGEEIVITRDGKPAARLVKESVNGGAGEGTRPLPPPLTLKEGPERMSAPQNGPGRKAKKATAEEIRAIAERFRALVKGDFSSQDINDILYDEDGLPK